MTVGELRDWLSNYHDSTPVYYRTEGMFIEEPRPHHAWDLGEGGYIILVDL